jgi:NAD(P)-dependent dehydrogenase (short-subunit alcohol dehydrogenase family)
MGAAAEIKAGFLATVPARRASTPEEVAQTIVFLGGDRTRYLTGQRIAVDGGYTAQ